ncbi:MAK10-like protein [Tanacetum coccineum]|uniref:MAK10-like protein n=1 Tax=Tanacetum coccineum TaxID=301880 RepID=A0ABQ4XD63_9ASTR
MAANRGHFSKVHDPLVVLFDLLPPYSTTNKITLAGIDHVFGLADEPKSYLVGIVKNVEVHIGRLKLLEDFYVIDMEKDHTTSLLVGRRFLATTSVVIDCRKSKIGVGEGVTMSIFEVKEIDLAFLQEITNRIACRNFFQENECEIFTVSGDGVRIFPDGVIFDEKKPGSS